MRTGISAKIASTLFGVHEATGERAFSTWLAFLRGSLRPFVRLPKPAGVDATTPNRWKEAGLERVVLVLNSVEIECDRASHRDIAVTLFSPLLNRPTGKVIVAVTPTGAICHISNAYGGGHTDTEVVELSGLIRKLKEAGFSNGGYSVMADRSFKPLAADLTREGLRYVPRPPKRVSPEEGESNQASAGRTETTAHVCNNVDRAIEALGEWKILGTKLEPADLDLLPMVVDVCGSLINMTCPLITD